MALVRPQVEAEAVVSTAGHQEAPASGSARSAPPPAPEDGRSLPVDRWVERDPDLDPIGFPRGAGTGFDMTVLACLAVAAVVAAAWGAVRTHRLALRLASSRRAANGARPCRCAGCAGTARAAEPVCLACAAAGCLPYSPCRSARPGGEASANKLARVDLVKAPAAAREKDVGAPAEELRRGSGRPGDR